MDTGSFKLLELLLIVGVVGYFYINQRNNLQRLKEEREAKQAEDAKSAQPTAQGDANTQADANANNLPPSAE